jgi:heme exporter protein A
MLSCNSLLFQINDKPLFHIGFTLFPGSITILRGSNGSGKSTLLRIISGLQSPTDGQVLFRGEDIATAQKPYVNYIGHDIGIKNELTVFENIALWSRLYGSEMIVPSAIHYFGLQDILHSKAFTLSSGNRQKVALARMLSCQADLWILDECETGLDDKNLALFNNIISTKANNGGIVIMSSHNDFAFSNTIEINMRDFYA